MIKVEVIERFSLGRFNELKNIIRATKQDSEGRLYVGDIFECSDDLADYLLGDNPLNRPVVKLIEVDPFKVIETEEAKDIAINFYTGEEVKPKKTKKKKK